jgi:hypothetical protein
VHFDFADCERQDLPYNDCGATRLFVGQDETAQSFTKIFLQYFRFYAGLLNQGFSYFTMKYRCLPKSITGPACAVIFHAAMQKPFQYGIFMKVSHSLKFKGEIMEWNILSLLKKGTASEITKITLSKKRSY